MKVLLTQTRPMTTPIREYDTRFIYVGFKVRYNTHTKTVSSIEKHSDGTLTYNESPSDTQVFSRAYATEHARVILYSETPRIWVEETSPFDYVVFVQQQPTQAV